MNKPIDYSKLKVGDIVVDRHGYIGRVVSITPDGNPDYRFCVLFEKSGSILSLAESGAYTHGDSPMVFLAPSATKNRAWINLYRDGVTGLAMASEELARKTARPGCVETRCIEWEVTE